MSSSRRTLRASPPGSTTWVYIGSDASLVVELYDHGEDAEASFGHDVAFLLRVAPEHKGPLLEALRGQPHEPRSYSGPRRPVRRRGDRPLDAQILDELERRFGSYFEVRAWFDASGIPYSHEFDSWA